MENIKVCHISTFSPTRCGIASYTEDLIKSLKHTEAMKIRILYSHEVQVKEIFFSINKDDITSYYEAASRINDSLIDVVSLQHEFGVFGGENGHYVYHLIERIKKPLITTFHTVSKDMSNERVMIIKKISQESKYVIVFSKENKEVLTKSFDIPEQKVRVIKHGIPNVNFILPEASKLRKELNSQLVFFSAGHIRPTKGYENSLFALRKFCDYNSNFKYLVLGSPQPQSPHKGGSEYYLKLQCLCNKLGLSENVIWINEYLNLEEFLQYFIAADIGLMPYTRSNQSSSGIVPMVIGCGRLVIATRFDYAIRLAKEIKGIRLTELDNPQSLYMAIFELTSDRKRMYSMMESNYNLSRSWLWEESAYQYRNVYFDAITLRGGGLQGKEV